jgi:superfamily II DNA or RNA helicase
MQIKLRPHQIRGVDAMSASTIKGQLIKPTGAGKTLTMIADALKEFQLKKLHRLLLLLLPEYF